VLPVTVFGGPHNELAELHAQLEKIGYTTLPVLPLGDDQAAGRMRRSGVPVVQMRLHRLRRVRSPLFWFLYPFRFLGDVVSLAALIRRTHANVVEGFTVNLQAAVAANIAGVPVVWKLADVTAPLPIRRLVARVLPRLAETVLVNGDATADAYPGLRRRLGDRLAIYYPPADTERFTPSPRLADRDSLERITVGTVANINPDKGYEYLVEAAYLVGNSRIDFLFVGARHETHARYAARLEQRVQQLRLSERVRFVGPREDIADLLREMDLFVVSSVREGSTTTALEAMACGLPVVATRVGAIPEVVDDGVTGLLVPPRDPSALAAAIRTLAEDPALRERLGRAGRRRVLERFGFERAVQVEADGIRRALDLHKRR
jgi:glycosyltransferase involved in cell wall biosynthesis